MSPPVGAPTRLILPCMLAATLAACSGMAKVPVMAVAEPASGSPAPVEGYDWFYHPEASEARLVYGLEASDDLRLGLECAKGTGALEITANAAHGVREIHLESGGDTERFMATGEASQVNDGDFLTAQSTTSEPVFQRFRRVGWMARWQGGARETYAPHPASQPDIERFFAFCG